MSNAPFEFQYHSGNETPALARLLDAHLTEEYGPDALVSGQLAFDDDKNFLGIQVNFILHKADLDAHVHVDGEENEEPGEYPHGNDKVAWDNFVEWMRGLGATHAFSFNRRWHGFGNAQPTQGDITLLDASSNLAPRAGINYHGHIITDGEHHGLMMPEEDQMASLLGILPPELASAIGKAMVARALEVDPSIDREAMDALLEQMDRLVAARDGGDLSDADKETAYTALRELEAALERSRSGDQNPQHKSPLELPDVRPDVPKAFYQN